VDDKNAVVSIKGDDLQLTASLVQTMPGVAGVSGRLEHVLYGIGVLNDIQSAGPADPVTSAPASELEPLHAYIMSDTTGSVQGGSVDAEEAFAEADDDRRPELPIADFPC
jgi:hypothetical protein